MTPFDDIKDFAAALTRHRAVVGLDLGTKTIGVAVSDRQLSVASPLETIKRTKFGADAAAILAIAAGRDLGGIVLGLPRNMDGSEGPRAQSTRAFARNLSALTDMPITFGTNACPLSPLNARCWRRIRHANVAPRSLIMWRRLIYCRARWTVWRI